jgi:hypothetical protein
VKIFEDKHFDSPDNTKSRMTALFLILMLLMLSKRASIIKNRMHIKKASTPTEIPKPHVCASPLRGQLPN